MATTERIKPIRLTFQSVQQVVVEDRDEDRFVTTAREAARACRYFEDLKDWREIFERFLAYLHNRCDTFSTQIVACYVSIGDEGLRIFITTPGEDYVSELDDAITDLDIDVSKNFPLCPADCIQIPSQPEHSLSSFFSPNLSFQVYGDRRHTSRKNREKPTVSRHS